MHFSSLIGEIPSMRTNWKLMVLLSAAIFAGSPSHAQKTKAVLGAEITSQFPTQVTGAITPLILRNVTTDFLNSWQQFPAINAQTGIIYTFQASDYGALVTFDNVAAVAAAIPTPIGSFGIGWNVFVRNKNAGTVTLTPVGALINGAASITVSQNQSVWVVSDGNNYQVWNNSTGTVTSVAFSAPSFFSITGSPCTAVCAISLTVAGTSGGAAFFDSATSLSSTNVLSANGVIYGGGAGVAPSTTAAGATGTLLRGGTPPAFTATPTLGTAGSVGGSIALANGTSGTITLSPSTGALLSSVLTLPIASDTLIAKATTDILTNKTLDTAGAGNVFKINTTQISATTGTGNTAVLQGSPSLTSPSLGVATGTSFNGLTINTTTGTLSVINGKVLGLMNSLNFQGTDSTTHIFPASSSSVAALNLADQTLAGGANVTSLAQSAGNITVDCGARPLQTITNQGAFAITAPVNDGSCIIKTTNTISASTITFSGFSVGSNTGDTLSTTNGYKYMIFIYRAGGDSTYAIKALQ